MTYTANRIDEIITHIRLCQDTITDAKAKIQKLQDNITNALRNGSKEDMKHSIQMIEMYDNGIKTCEARINELKAELISPAFRKDVDPEAIVIVRIKLGTNGKVIDRKWKNKERVLVGDTVNVVNKNGEYSTGKVVQVIVVKNSDSEWAEGCH